MIFDRFRSAKLQLSPNTETFSVALPEGDVPLTAGLYPDEMVGLRNLGVAVEKAQGFLPLGLLRISAISSGVLVPFASLKKEGRFQLWRLGANCRFVEQIPISPEELALLFRINIITIDQTEWYNILPRGLAERLGSIRHAVEAMANQIGSNFSDDPGIHENARTSKALTFALADMRVLSFEELTQDLLTFLSRQRNDRTKVDAIRKVWQSLCTAGLWHGKPQIFHSQFRYEYLRETVALLSGKDVILNLLTGEHQFCSASRFFGIPSRGGIAKFCISVQGDLPLVDFRGSGWSASSFAYQIGSYFIVESPWKGRSTWPVDYDTMLNNHSATLNRALNEQKLTSHNALVVNSSSQRNLGHFLWNDLSGLFMAQDVPEVAHRVSLGIFDSGISGFGGTESYYNFAAHSHLFPAGLSHFPNPTSIDALFTHPRPVILKSLTLSPELVRRARGYAARASKDPNARERRFPSDKSSTVNILVNIRIHNKNWRNISECFEAYLSNDYMVNKPPLRFFFEYSDGAEDIVRGLDAQLAKLRIPASHARNYGLSDLTRLMYRMDLIIAPVGSGLVLPTWVFGLPVIAHGDPRHMNQLRWWDNVSERVHGGKNRMIRALGKADITPFHDKFYSDYTIRPEAFCRALREEIDVQIAGRK